MSKECGTCMFRPSSLGEHGRLCNKGHIVDSYREGANCNDWECTYMAPDSWVWDYIDVPVKSKEKEMEYVLDQPCTNEAIVNQKPKHIDLTITCCRDCPYMGVRVICGKYVQYTCGNVGGMDAEAVLMSPILDPDKETWDCCDLEDKE